MKNKERSTRKTSELAALLLGVALGSSVPKIASDIGSHLPEQQVVSTGKYGDYQIKTIQESVRTVVIMEDDKTNTRIHGVDYKNDGSIDMAEPMMGYRGTGKDKEVLQSAYNSVRNK